LPCLSRQRTYRAFGRRLADALSPRPVGTWRARTADRRAPASTRRRPIGEIEHSVAQFHAFGPPRRRRLNITPFSYDGAVNLGFTTDEAAVTDRELFLRCLDQTIAEMLELAERAAALTA
jgi:WS/DGAT C-terminal domain